MTTFNKIINNVINLDNNIFSFNYNKSDKIAGIHKIFFSILSDIKLYKNYKNKFDFINQTLNNFYFLKKNTEKTEFYELFCKIQHIYHILNRFVYLYKYKKSKIIVDMDLQLNKINITDTNVICIYHVNARYLFKIEDILKLIYISLTNCYSFMADPISIKNPYNNIPFNKSILYFIYYYLISYTKLKHIKPEYTDIFFKFKESNFNMTKFVNNYEYILREYTIKNYLNNSTKETLFYEIKILIKKFNNRLPIRKMILISQDFPEDELLRIMKPYLYLELQEKYSLVQKNKVDAKNKLNKKLSQFQSFNPQFGKKIIKFKDIHLKNGKIKRVKSHIEFNMIHKKFNTYEIETFMNNHLIYKYDDEYDNEYDNEYEESDENGESEFTFTILSNVTFNTHVNTQNENNDEGNEEGEGEEQEEEQEEEGEDEEEEEQEEEEQEEEDDEEDNEFWNDEDEYEYEDEYEDEVDSIS